MKQIAISQERRAEFLYHFKSSFKSEDKLNFYFMYTLRHLRRQKSLASMKYTHKTEA